MPFIEVDPSQIKFDSPVKQGGQAINGFVEVDPSQIKFDAPKGEDKGAGRAALQGFNATVPYGNRLTAAMGAGIASLATGEPYSSLYDEARANQAATSEANPNAELAGAIGGIGVTLPIGLSKAVSSTPILGATANAFQKATTATGNFIRGGEVATNAGRLARVGNIAGQSARGAIAAAPVGALYGAGAAPQGEQLSGAASGAGLAGAIGGALPIAGAALGSAAAALTPKISEGMADIASVAQKYNIPISLDQISGSRALKNIQKVSQEIPLSGQQGFREKQLLAFNRALFKTVGVDADMFNTKTMAKAFQQVGGEFDNLTKGKTFNVGGELIDDLAKTSDDVASTYGSDAAAIYQKEASKVINDFASGDEISGELIAFQRARLNKLARNAVDPNIKGALLDLENNIVDAITSKDPALQKALSEAKYKYKNLIVLEPIANKAKGGFISPASLNNRVSQVYKRAHTIGNSGDIGELARVGNEILPELGGSDTIQKGAYLASITGGIANPASIPLIGATVGANRAFQSGINRNQSLINKAVQSATKKPLQITVRPQKLLP